MTERKRATGFVLMDAAFTADRKFIRLAQTAPSPLEYAAAVGVFWLLLADCRRAKSPNIHWDEYEEYTDQIAMLRSVRLLREGGFEYATFQKWAPAYRSVSERTRESADSEHGAYPSVPDGNSNTVASVQVSSGQVNGGGAGGTFMGWKHREPERLPGEAVVPRHNGQHPDCLVCGTVKAGDAA